MLKTLKSTREKDVGKINTNVKSVEKVKEGTRKLVPGKEKGVEKYVK